MAYDNIRNVRFRIDFVVREVCIDGSVPDDELRFVQMGDELHRGDIFDYFNRMRDAIQMLFPQLGSVVVLFNDVGPNKIQVIKAIREITGLGLKESKDMIKMHMGTAAMSFKDMQQATAAAKKLEAAGAKPAIRGWRKSDEESRPPGLPLINVTRFDRDTR